MARIANVNVSDKKHVIIGLTDIYGVGRSISAKICADLGIEPTKKVRDLTGEELEALREELASDKYMIEGDLRGKIARDIKRLKDIGCYRGVRHRRGLPVNGQRTRTNARTRKGPVRAAGKKR